MGKLTVNSGVNLSEEQAAYITDALNAADRLATAVISGNPGQMQSALTVARTLDLVKRSKSTGK